MMDREKLEAGLAELPLYEYFWFDTGELVFSDRIRWICEHECPMYGKSWACPPGVGPVAECRKKCLGYSRGLCVSTIVEVADISDIDATLATRGDHERVTDRVAALLKEQGLPVYVLSTEACAVCSRCAIADGLPCRMPGRMHPCVESHGIVLSDLAERHGIPFQYGGNVVTWFSLILYREEA